MRQGKQQKREVIKHLPLEAFLKLACDKRRADPLPEAMLFVAILFTMSAVFIL